MRRQAFECRECDFLSATAKDLMIDAKTVGDRGVSFPKTFRLQWIVMIPLTVVWTGFFLWLLTGADTSREIIVVLFFAIGGPVVFARAYLEDFKDYREAELVPGTRFRCRECKFWWTVRADQEAPDETLLVGENDPEQRDEPWTPTELPANLGVRDDAQIAGLERLRDLHATGGITDEEYQLAKSRFLAGDS